ncbi:MAG: zinc ABC transporter substrate-binding protein [Actinobacteria bacterium]|nr:zinc ABC transporter substrate-binding protein [Actinomycetota bacterium]
MAIRTRTFLPALGVVLALGGLAGCGSEGSGGASGSGGADGKLAIEASFYPLQWVAERVGGDHVSVANLTPPGAEPHDLELTPKRTAALADADLVLYLSGFQPAVDDAVASVDAEALDAASVVDLDLTASDDGHDHDHGDEGAGHDEGAGVDPHFWLDPTRLAKVVGAVADSLADLDPEHEDDYRASAADAVADLEELDGELEAGLETCESRDVVTSHQAFGYLAQRYDLRQVGISGLSPDEEPSAADLADVIGFVKDHDVRTIYFETLVSPDVARTVASETGADTAVLDPIEGLSDASAGNDYLEVMRSNLASLRAGQRCT